MVIDHHIQSTLLEKLLKSDSPVPYSSLKQADIENSLFSYHLNKLISRRIVQKDTGGYSVTVSGARWLNDTGFGIVPAENLRVNVVLVIEDEDGEYLIAQRAGQFKAINDFILPGHYFTNEADLDDQIKLTMTSYIPVSSLIKRSDYGFMQIKLNYPDTTMHNLFHVSHCLTKHFDLTNPYYALELEWLTPSQLHAIVHPSATIIRDIITSIGNTKPTTTPLFVG